ncbi:IclR family transcriptional regulator [Pandoraea sp. XJJ-1]|uniref:Transcriptional repressor IclR n=2 Tax=Pandoraea TaxID=93217 RepID=A0A5E4VJX0_9BURK|nr:MULTISPECIES: IclR family transcriptional regulator [Pandoraea]MBN9117505.1 IclR family transcriptional regulator [Pandoraea sp.]OJY24889.1 MAG: IclR family transcriptional regulator [Pandoraea sp. 64-18]QBC31066.1 IclR family transcriptional regulator [Pandoraea sp. XY-2]WAL84075.1 IclR family transcriptional regulator [Pandoraea sp. XJJ-1]VVE10157.1 Transcriptional repressor IclR [Pandoraea soli]
MTASNQSNAAAVRAFRVLETLATAGGPLSMMDLVNALDLPKQTVHRILTQLKDAWLITRSANDRRYECSPRVRALAINVLMQTGAAAARHGLLEQLVTRIGETCNLTMLSGNDVIYVDRVETEWPLRMHLQPGSHVPMHCSASGKLLLSFLPKERRERLIETLPLRKFSEQTLTDRGEFRTELERTRRRKMGINNQEHLQGLIAIAVPVMLNRNRACAAIAVQAPIGRLTLDDLLAFEPELRFAAEETAKTFKN